MALDGEDDLYRAHHFCGAARVLAGWP